MWNVTRVRTVVSFVAVLAAYGVYSLCAVPWIEPPITESQSSEVPADVPSRPSGRYQSLLRNLFPPGSWELANPKVLKTERVILLFRDYQLLAEGRLEIRPCTLVVTPPPDRRGRGGAGRVFVMRAPEKAVLKFDRPLDLWNGEIGRLVGGWLTGPVTIQSDESHAGADDSIEIATQNIQLDSRRIWTPHEVVMRMGRSVVQGRDLIVNLMPANSAPGDKSFGPLVGGIKSLELVHVDKIDLYVRSKDSSPQGSARGDAEQTLMSADGETRVAVACRGPFQLDLSENRLTLEDDVDLTRLYANGASDQLSCQLLALEFIGLLGDPDVGNGFNPKTRPESATARRSTLELSRIIATGRPVTMTSPATNGHLQTEYLEYDVQRGSIRLESQGSISLRYQRYGLESSRVYCQLNSRNELRSVRADGPGRVWGTLQPDRSQPFEVAWSKQLHFRPHDGEQVLSLTGSSKIRFAEASGLSADEVHVWLRPPKNNGAAEANQAEVDTDTNAAPESLQPQRMLARGNVNVQSPQLDASTNELELWIESAVGAGPTMARNGSSNRRNGSDTSFLNFAVGSGRRPSSAQSPVGKFHVRGDLVRVLLLRENQATGVEDVTVSGHARVVEIADGHSDVAPVEILADMLEVHQASSTGGQVKIRGNPARVRGRGMMLSGDFVRMDRATSRMWIDGPGEAAFTGHLLNFEPPAARPGTGTGRVTWSGRMEFSGQTAYFQNDVVARTSDQYVRTDAAEIMFDRAVDFGSARQPAGEIQIRRVTLDGEVSMENRSFDDDGLTAIDRMNIRRLVIDRSSGRIEGDGPGWISSVRRGDRSAFPAPNLATRQRPSEKLSYLHAGFQRGIDGNINQRRIHLLQQVEVIHGPVASWDEQLVVGPGGKLGESAILLTCDRLTVAQTSSGSAGGAPIELEAIGNTVVEGKGFTARASRISYAQSKDQLILDGDGRTFAELWHGPSHTAAGKIMFWPKTNALKIEDGHDGELIQRGTP